MRRIQRTILALVVLTLLPRSATGAQDAPFVVHDTKPVITKGPYLVDASETAVTVVWMTDTPSHSEVRFGLTDALGRRADVSSHGLVPVGTVHAIRVTGLAPGQTYQYKAVSTRVVKMKAYWPEKGLSVESPVQSFTTFDRNKATVQ
jgi:hypothetical protein